MIYFFETIKVQNKQLQNLSFHKRRVAKTAAAFGFTAFSFDEITCTKEGLFRLKLIYSKKGIKEYSFYPYTQKQIKDVKIVPSDIRYDYKYLDRKQLQQLKPAGFDEIFIIKEGLVTDSTIANLAFYNGKEWITPKKPLLEGTTRDRLVQEGFLKEQDISVERVKSFESFAFLNAMIGFYEVKNLKIWG